MAPFIDNESQVNDSTTASTSSKSKPLRTSANHPVIQGLPEVASPQAPQLFHWPIENEQGYRINETPMGTRRPLRIIVLGAGASGINFVKKAQDDLENIEVVCYEKNAEVGGTWLENV